MKVLLCVTALLLSPLIVYAGSCQDLQKSDITTYWKNSQSLCMTLNGGGYGGGTGSFYTGSGWDKLVFTCQGDNITISNLTEKWTSPSVAVDGTAPNRTIKLTPTAGWGPWTETATNFCN